MSFAIRNIRLPSDNTNLAAKLYAVRCQDGKVTEILLENGDTQKLSGIVDGKGGLLLPSLCHSHIHLDKCYILDNGAPLVTGDFAEALRTTSEVKATFKAQVDDLYARGNRLIRESLEAGVTSMRAHIEVDNTVDNACLNAGIKLKDDWDGLCDVQLCLFLQDPIFDSREDEFPGTNASIATKVVEQHTKSLGAIGSAPYVERTRDQQHANIRFVLDLAMKYDKHVDFHIDYDLSPLPADLDCDSDAAPLVYYLLDLLHELRWTERMPGKTVVLGHATRLSLFSYAQLADLQARIGSLPVYFVGLLQSDMYMMGRDSGQRGTLNICKLGREHGLSAAMGVNNVGNAFTPQGTPDPLSLCPLGVAVYQDGTLGGCKILLRAVSTTSKCAIGLPESEDVHSLCPAVGSPADFVILHDNRSVQSAALSPSYDRTTIKGGRGVAWRSCSKWLARDE